MSNAAHAKYRQTEKGKAAMKRCRDRYKQSAKGKAKIAELRAAYFKTEKGKEARKRQDAARYQRKKALREAAKEAIAPQIKQEKPIPVKEYTGIIIHRCL